MTAALARSFASLSVPNYRRYFAGQVVSLSGNWMQTVAEMWLILRLTNSGLAVGLTTALQFLPILLAGLWGGLLADRIPKRRLLATTQALMAVPALALFGLTVTGMVEPWMVFALVFVRGSVNAVDNPTRQSFVVEMVGADRVVNAVSLNSVLVHVARIAGPALAGITIATLGVAPCFLINALSFVAMIVALRWMEPDELEVTRPAERAPGQLRSAVRYVWRTPELRIPLVLMGLVSTLAFNFQVLLPLLARFTWHGSASTYALLTTTMAVGSVIGALAVGARGRVTSRTLVIAAAAFGALTLLAAAAPVLPLQLAVLAPLGAASVTFAAGTNSALQLSVAPHMRGRVMALYSVVFLGSTPIGGPLAGWLAEVAGPRVSLAVGGVAALAGAAWARAAWARSRPRSQTTAPTTRIAAATATAVPTREHMRPGLAEGVGDAPDGPAHVIPPSALERKNRRGGHDDDELDRQLAVRRGERARHEAVSAVRAPPSTRGRRTARRRRSRGSRGRG